MSSFPDRTSQSYIERRKALGVPVMSPELDDGWLDQIGPEASVRTPTWFERMNSILSTATPAADASPFEQRMAQWASVAYLIELGWLDKDNPMRKDIESFYNNSRMSTLRPPVVIHAARTYASYGINLQRILKSPHLRRITYYPDTIRNKVDGLTGAGLNATAMIARYPDILDRNIKNLLTKTAYIRRLASTLQWEKSANELIETRPSILTSSMPLLSFLGRLVAEHGSPQITIGDIGSTVMRPAESHLASVALDQAWNPMAAQRWRRAVPPEQRREHALKLLHTTSARAAIGAPLAKAYLRYQPLTLKERQDGVL